MPLPLIILPLPVPAKASPTALVNQLPMAKRLRFSSELLTRNPGGNDTWLSKKIGFGKQDPIIKGACFSIEQPGQKLPPINLIVEANNSRFQFGLWRGYHTRLGQYSLRAEIGAEINSFLPTYDEHGRNEAVAGAKLFIETKTIKVPVSRNSAFGLRFSIGTELLATSCNAAGNSSINSGLKFRTTLSFR